MNWSLIILSTIAITQSISQPSAIPSLTRKEDGNGSYIPMPPNGIPIVNPPPEAPYMGQIVYDTHNCDHSGHRH